MRELVSEVFGYRRPDGKVVGWWRSRDDRNSAVNKFSAEYARVAGSVPAVDLVTKRSTTVERLTTERTVRL